MVNGPDSGVEVDVDSVGQISWTGRFEQLGLAWLGAEILRLQFTPDSPDAAHESRNGGRRDSSPLESGLSCGTMGERGAEGGKSDLKETRSEKR